MNSIQSEKAPQEDVTQSGAGARGSAGTQRASNGHARGDGGTDDAPHDGHNEENPIPHDLKKPSGFMVAFVTVVFVALLAALFAVGYFPHRHREKQARADAAEVGNQAPVVSIAQPKASTSSKDIILPGDVRPFQVTALYSRATGYLKMQKVDIGDHVKAHDLLAEIDTPDVDAQLAQSKGALEEARANIIKDQSDVDLARRTLERYEGWQKAGTGGVTEQMLDEKRAAYDQATGTLAAAQAGVVAAQADVQRLTVMQGFEKIYAPFDGIITARNYDLGALLTASSTSNKELFDLAQTDTLRVFANVPQTYASSIKIGQPAYVRVRNFPGREFEGIVARSAGALDPTTRTIAYELHLSNPDGLLFAGMYVQVRLPVTPSAPVLIIPSSALVFGASGTRVAVVKDDKIHFQQITVGRDLGTELEVTEGVSAGDQIVSNPGERIAEGAIVQVESNQPKPNEAKPQKVADGSH